MKTPRKKLIKKLDKIHSQFIRLRDKKCVVCESKENLQCGHLFTRAAYSTRWDLTMDGNCHVNCSSCNLRHEYDPYPFNEWYIRNFSKSKWDELHRRHKQPLLLKNHHLEEMYRIIESFLKAIETTEEKLF